MLISLALVICLYETSLLEVFVEMNWKPEVSALLYSHWHLIQDVILRTLKLFLFTQLMEMKIMVSRPSNSVQSLSHVWLFATPWIIARQASLSVTNSQSSLRLMSIESVMLSNHLILCRPLLLLPPIPPSISLFRWVNSSHEVAKVLEFQH